MEQDAELIRRARQGCADSFRQLMEAHGPPVYRFLVRQTGGRTHDAEDLYQEAMLKVAEGIHRYQHQGTFSAWVFRIARNVFLDARKRRRVEEAPLPESLAHHDDPDGTLVVGGLERALAAALDGLTPKQREVFLMRHYGELTFKQIAEVLEAPLGTVLARMSYAMRALRPRLQAWRRERMGEAS